MMIHTIDNFLEPEDLVKFRNYVINSGLTQNIREDSTLTTEFWNTYGDKINQNVSDLHFTGLYSQVTFSHSAKPVTKHTDCRYKDEKYKLLIYLNSVPQGGTLFFGKTTTTIIQNVVNRAVIFDIRLPHEGQKFTINGTKKIAIGFRLKEE